jgi:DNA-binding NarL/FixJ family response regulator
MVPTRVAIVDDHVVVGLAVRALVESSAELEFAGSAASVAELLAGGVRPDLTILDLNLRDHTQPSENVEQLRRSGSLVLVLTSGENPYLIREVSRAGVLGIVRKSSPADEIRAAIERAAPGEPVVTTEWASAVDADPELRGAPLTEREREVLALYASGLGAKSVARRLCVSENTVDDHIKRIRAVYERLSRPARTKVELYQRGVEDGFIPGPEPR